MTGGMGRRSSATAFFGGLAWLPVAHLLSDRLHLGFEGVTAMEIAYVVVVAFLLYSLEEERPAQSANRQVMQCLAKVAAFYDGDTATHGERIGALAFELASEMGVPRAHCETLRHAAVLHDLGKIVIDKQILNKTGPLTTDERSAIKLHVDYGAELIERTKLEESTDPVLDVAMVAIRTHHEWWDGGGYPRGLSGGEIPLEGRIVAVCDVFDALATDRPYRSAMDPEEALDVVRRSSGTQFDPDIVEAFERRFPRLLNIYSE